MVDFVSKFQAYKIQVTPTLRQVVNGITTNTAGKLIEFHDGIAHNVSDNDAEVMRSVPAFGVDYFEIKPGESVESVKEQIGLTTDEQAAQKWRAVQAASANRSGVVNGPKCTPQL